MDIRPVAGSDGLERGDPQWWRRFGVSWWQDWTGVLMPHRHNWSDFTVVHLSGEAEWCMGNAELCVALFGCHLRFTYYWPNENREELKRTARLVRAGLVETTPIDLDE